MLPMDDSAVNHDNSSLPARGFASSFDGEHVSLEGMHGTVTVPHEQAGFWEQWRAFVGPAILVSVGYMDPGNWGTDLQGGAQFKYGLLWVVGAGQLHGDLHASHLRPARRGHRQRSGAVLPRLVSRLDALAQLAAVRSWPSAPATWPKCSAAPSRSTCCSTSRCSGPSSSPRSTCCCCSPCSASACAPSKRSSASWSRPSRVCYFIEIFVLPQTRPSFLRDGPRPDHARTSGRRA